MSDSLPSHVRSLMDTFNKAFPKDPTLGVISFQLISRLPSNIWTTDNDGNDVSLVFYNFEKASEWWPDVYRLAYGYDAALFEPNLITPLVPWDIKRKHAVCLEHVKVPLLHAFVAMLRQYADPYFQ